MHILCTFCISVSWVWYTVPVSNLVSHLDKFGLTVKPSESLGGGAALGLQMDRARAGNLVFTRGSEIPKEHEEMSRCELFST